MTDCQPLPASEGTEVTGSESGEGRNSHEGCPTRMPGTWGQAHPEAGWVGAAGSWGPYISQALLLVLWGGCSAGELSRKVADGDLPTPVWIASPATHKLWQGRVVCPPQSGLGLPSTEELGLRLPASPFLFAQLFKVAVVCLVLF